MINAIIWAIVTVLIFMYGLLFTFKFNFVQFKIKDMIKSFKDKHDKKEVSLFESFSMSLGARIGVGSLSGIALAIYIGGPGTIFWMLISSLIAATTTFVEAILGVLYNEKDGDFIYKGGPSYYIKKGLNNKYLAFTYAIIIIIAYIAGFLTIQANTIVKSVNSIVNINPNTIAILIVIGTSLIIFNSIKKLASFTAFIVPLMGFLYLAMGIYVTICNIDEIPNILSLIIKDAFNLKPIFSGFLATMIIGIQKGIFANEAGIGTSAIASGVTNADPIKQAFIQMFGVLFTSLIVCTITAFFILTSDYTNLTFINLNGVELISYAFNYHLGSLGSIGLCIITILFAFSTIISGYYFGESSLKYLFKNISKKNLNLFKIITIALIGIGGIVEASLIWNTIDFLVGIMAIINIYALSKLYKEALKFYKMKKN